MSNLNLPILPFGSGDDSVVLECAMTDSADITAQGGTLMDDATVDATKGVTGLNGCVRFDLTASYLALLEKGFQISFETNWQNITTSATSGDPSSHGGVDHSGQVIHLAFNGVVGTGQPYAFLYSSGAIDSLSFELASNTDAPDAKAVGRQLSKARAAQTGGYARVTIGSTASRVFIYINDVLISDEATAGLTSGDFRYLWIGSGPGAAGVGAAAVQSGYYYRNLTVAAKPIAAAHHPLLDVAWIGDSLVAQSQSDTLAANLEPYHSSIEYGMKRIFGNMGLTCEVDISNAVSGSTIYDASGNNIVDQITGALSKSPRIVCYRGGTNDALSEISTATIQADLEGQLTTLLDAGSVQYVFLGTIPSLNNDPVNGTAAVATRTDELNAIINAMPAWAAANGYTGRVVIVDQFTDFGGHTPNTDLLQADNYHPGSYGKGRQGELYAEKIREYLG